MDEQAPVNNLKIKTIMKNLLRAALVSTIIMSLTGCGVSRANQKNWTPDYSNKNTHFYNCLRESQGFQSSANISGNYGSAQSGQKTNKEMLSSCMISKGYQLRKTTKNENIITIITLPLSIPLILLGGDRDFY